MNNKEFKLPIILSGVFGIILSVICLSHSLWLSLLCLAVFILIIALFYIFTKKRFAEIQSLNTYLERVCSGDFDLNISNNTEGELSVLQNNLYKVILMLRSSNEALSKDKVYLASSLADISHQLKTPLTSIMVMTDLIKDEDDPDKIKEFAGVVENQTQRMRWLIQTLLKLSKLDAQTADFKYEQVSVKSILKASLEPFLITLDLKGIDLIDTTEDFSIRGDRNWSEEAFANIIKNCIEHTEQNGTIRISSNTTSIYDEIIIEDNGCGISQEDLPHIFERFYHGRNASSDSVGIGLALSKTIFEQENGKISIESEENVGSRFSIKFYKAII